VTFSRQSLALALTTQNKQEKIHQKHKINKLALGMENTHKNSEIEFLKSS